MSNINNNIEIKANDILVKNDMLKIPVDLITIAHNNDIEVYHKCLPDSVSGAIRYNKDTKKFQILIDDGETENRQRFTLAHELAHYFLEKEKLLCGEEIHFDTQYRKSTTPREAEVDYLAGALLMDKSLVTKLYNIYPSVSLLAKTFNVSESAMTMRLMMLGLI